VYGYSCVVERVSDQRRAALGARQQTGGNRVVVVGALLLGMAATVVEHLVRRGVAPLAVEPVEEHDAVTQHADRPAPLGRTAIGRPTDGVVNL